MEQNNNKEKKRVVTLLSRTQVDYLDQLGKDSLFFGGKKLSRVYILGELVDMLMKAGVSIKELQFNGEELSAQLLRIIRGTVAKYNSP